MATLRSMALQEQNMGPRKKSRLQEASEMTRHDLGSECGSLKKTQLPTSCCSFSRRVEIEGWERMMALGCSDPKRWRTNDGTVLGCSGIQGQTELYNGRWGQWKTEDARNFLMAVGLQQYSKKQMRRLAMAQMHIKWPSEQNSASP